MSEQFVSLGETQLGVDRIATSPTAYALYENVLAFFRGSPTSRAKQALSPWAVVPATAVSAGAVIRYADLSTPAINDRHEVAVAASVMMMCSGTVRVSFTQSRVILTGTPGDINAGVRRLRGTTETLLESWNSTGSNARSVDVDVQPGDSIMVTHRGRDNVAGQQAISKISLFRIGVASGNPHFWCFGPGSLLLSAEPQ